MAIIQPVADTASVASIIAVFTGILPAVATVFAIVWYAIMIYDWYETRREKRAADEAKQVLAIAAEKAKEVLKDARTTTLS